MNDSWPKSKRPDYKKGIYILPNLFTTLSLYFGFSSIILSINGSFAKAAYYIIFAAFCDALDGTVARMTNTTSNFGVEYDSLCDLVSFGVAPAIMIYLWALQPGHLTLFFDKRDQVGLVVSFLFAACGALRLARFNVYAGVRDPGYFQGLPIPAGAGILATMVLWHYRKGEPAIAPNSLMVLILVIVLAYFMVSSIDYLSHKNKKIFRSKSPLERLFLAILILGFIAIRPKSNMFPLAMLYLTSGPIITIIRRRRARKFSREALAEASANEPPAKEKEE